MLWGLLILLAAGLVAWWLLMVLYTAWLQTHPTRRRYAFAVSRSIPGDPSEIVGPSTPNGLDYTSWTVLSRGVELPVWDIRGLDAHGPTFIITHGWGESRVLALQRAAALAQLAARIVLWDLPAHGDAPSGTNTLGHREHEDLLAIIERVRTDAGSRVDLVLHGFSLGAGVSIVAGGMLTGELAPKLIVAEAPYRLAITPVRNVLELRGLPHAMTLGSAMALLGLRTGAGPAWRDFDRVRSAAKLTARTRLLVLHGSADLISPPGDGREIAAAAPNAELVSIAGAGHGDLWTNAAYAEQCVTAIKAALAKCTSPSTPAEPTMSLPS